MVASEHSLGNPFAYRVGVVAMNLSLAWPSSPFLPVVCQSCHPQAKPQVDLVLRRLYGGTMGHGCREDVSYCQVSGSAVPWLP